MGDYECDCAMICVKDERLSPTLLSSTPHAEHQVVNYIIVEMKYMVRLSITFIKKQSFKAYSRRSVLI